MFLVLAMGLAVAGLVFVYLYQGAVLARLRAERAQVVLTLEKLERARLDLIYQVDLAYSLEEIAVRAQALGMGPFDEKRTRYLVVEGGGR